MNATESDTAYPMNPSEYSMYGSFSSNETRRLAAGATEYDSMRPLYSSNETRRMMNTTEYAAAYPASLSEYGMTGFHSSQNETRRLLNETEYGTTYPVNTSSNYGYLRTRR